MSSVDLPPPETPVTQVNRPSGISAVMFFKLLPRALTTRSMRCGDEVGNAALRDDMAAVNARARPQVEHVIRVTDGVLVVLDHDHGIAEVAQALQRLDE